MELELVNKELIDISTLDTFTSVIWRDVYCGHGDFELILPISAVIVPKIRMEYYLTSKDSDHAMIIEKFNIHSETDKGIQVIMKGRSLESILFRRIVWAKTSVSGKLQDAIHGLLDSCAINPSNPKRKISRLEFEESTDPIFDTLTVNTQFTEDTYLYNAITSLCLSAGVGYKITITDAGKFRFKLYTGKDRSFSQTENPYVVFSPNFDNIINSDYQNITDSLKNVTLVSGELGIENIPTTATVILPGEDPTDLDRREIFTDAKDISRTIQGEEQPLTEEEYLALLNQRGLENLSQNAVVETFEGEADTITSYIFGEDFFMGDILQVANEYGSEARSRVTELIHSQDLNSTKVYPTFSAEK
jgi:hypothetical protein